MAFAGTLAGIDANRWVAMGRVLKVSRPGFVVAGLFLFAAAAVVVWVFFAASLNPGDSGESGILLLPFAMPWIAIIPEAWLGLGVGVGCILFNGVILYCVFGGLRFRPSARSGNTPTGNP